MTFKTLLDLLLELPDLMREPVDHKDEGAHHPAVGLGNRRRGLQLQGVQRLVDLLRPPIEVAGATRGGERAADPRPSEPPSPLRRRRHPQDAARLLGGKVALQRGQRTRVELPQRAPELVHLPLARPHERLVRPREHLDRLGEIGVACHLPVVVTVRADQIGEHLRIARIGLGAGGGVTVAVPGDRERVDGVDAVTRLEEGSDEQPAVDLDADHDLGRILGVLGHYGVQATDAFGPVRHSPLGQDPALLIQHTHVVVRLGPIDPNEDHDSSFPWPLSPEEVRGDLMDQCSKHAIPPAVRPPRQPVGARSSRRARRLSACQCSPTGGSGTACPMHAVGSH